MQLKMEELLLYCFKRQHHIENEKCFESLLRNLSGTHRNKTELHLKINIHVEGLVRTEEVTVILQHWLNFAHTEIIQLKRGPGSQRCHGPNYSFSAHVMPQNKTK